MCEVLFGFLSEVNTHSRGANAYEHSLLVLVFHVNNMLGARPREVTWLLCPPPMLVCCYSRIKAKVSKWPLEVQLRYMLLHDHVTKASASIQHSSVGLPFLLCLPGNGKECALQS